jgi:D-glycero-D-manno-heptose 1,7-bisphosphate phosphatase
VKLIILDRDGTINEDRDDYVKSADEWLPIEGSLEAIARLNEAGFHVVIASNQAALGKGLIDMTALNAMHSKMNKLLAAKGGRVDAIFFCPHTNEDDCDCRKPKAGLFHQIALRYGLVEDEAHTTPLKGIPVIGDTLRDLIAGSALGTVPYLVLTGKGRTTQHDPALPKGTKVFADLAAAASAIIAAQVEKTSS